MRITIELMYLVLVLLIRWHFCVGNQPLKSCNRVFACDFNFGFLCFRKLPDAAQRLHQVLSPSYWDSSGVQSGFGIQHLKSAWAAQEIIPWLLLYIKSTPLFSFFCHFSLSSLALFVSFSGFFCV